jgi:pimeloyl-ACP methyl ester carboxylesterase
MSAFAVLHECSSYKMIKVLPTLLLALLSGSLVACTHTQPSPTERSVDVNVDGKRLHLLVVGEGPGKPSVILESGGGGGVGWTHVRSEIARCAQVVTYDRAGIGSSEPRSAPRDARTIARELHAALHQAGVKPPYVLVGQSLGGLYVQVFAAEYPQETAGLVLVDPTYASTELCLSIDQVKAWYMAHQPQDWPRVQAVCRDAPEGLQGFLAVKYKLMEEFLQTIPEPRRSAMRGEWWAMIDQLIGPNPHWECTGGTLQEATVMADSFRQAIAARPLPRVPTLLLAARKMDLDEMPAHALTSNVRALQAEARRWKMAVYQKWIDDTPGAKLIIVEGSGHDIESQRPQAVIDAVRQVLR